jgi:hypothetical protein
VTTDKAPRASNQTFGNVIMNMGVASGAGWWSEERDKLVTKEEPGFVDFEKRDFALRKDSVVYKTLPDFEPIPFGKIELREK